MNEESFIDTVDLILSINNLRDAYTANHQTRVSELAYTIGLTLGLDERSLSSIKLAGLVHDIGKIGLPVDILSKPTVLNNAEYELIKSHSETGYKLIKPIKTDFPIATIILQHHERIDGSGYPYGLTKNNLLIESRIISVADVVESMMSHRPYRPIVGEVEALREIEKNAGIIYDPEVVRACLNIFKNKFIFKSEQLFDQNKTD